MEKQFRLAETPRALREHSGLRAVGMNGARVVSGREMTIRRRSVEGRPGVIAISGVFPLARMRSEWFSSGGFGFRGSQQVRTPTMPVSPEPTTPANIRMLTIRAQIHGIQNMARLTEVVCPETARPHLPCKRSRRPLYRPQVLLWDVEVSTATVI